MSDDKKTADFCFYQYFLHAIYSQKCIPMKDHIQMHKLNERLPVAHSHAILPTISEIRFVYIIDVNLYMRFLHAGSKIL